jgi:hypothetical protein
MLSMTRWYRPRGRAAAAAMALASAALLAAPAATASAAPAGGIPPPPYDCQVNGLAPCAARTQHTPVILYFHNGGSENIGTTLVQITCYYPGTPVINGDNIEDHVDLIYDSTPGETTSVDGHVPDYNVDLGGNNPWTDGIPPC